MNKEKLRQIIKSSAEDIWYNKRSINPVEDMTNFLTDKIFNEIRATNDRTAIEVISWLWNHQYLKATPKEIEELEEEYLSREERT